MGKCGGTKGGAARAALAGAAVLLAFLPGPLLATGTKPPKTEIRKTAALPVTQQMLKLGAVDCAARTQQIAAALGKPGDNYLVQVQRENPNRSVISMKIVPGARTGEIGTLFMAPGQASGCGAVYQRTTYWEASCPELVAQKFPGLSARMLGPAGTMLVTLNENEDAIAMKIGNGCLTIQQVVAK